MSDDELHARIRTAKEKLGNDLVILGHFYQRDEVIQYADFVGDSFQLANAALTRPEASTIVFCGVHFMAETADILARPDQHVILPNLAAGCSMADMADEDSVEAAWEDLMELYADETGPDGVGADGLASVIPVTYMNSSAALKAFCGRHGGIVCTSSNASTVLGVGLRPRPAGAVLPRPAPGPQHGQGDGRTAGADADVEPAQAPRRQHRGRAAGRQGDPVARLLLGAQALQRGADRAGPGRLPGRAR